ncbi:MAG: peptidylprolyl isomerase, partial [Clostridia bacterium]|nr:peptidylprolyl isomerase [Clostridia bacterium]
VKVTPEEVRKLYEENKEKFQSEETVTASHILVAEEETAKDLLEKIKSGEMTFEDAAKNFSTCPSGKNGGSLGEFTRGQMVPEFDEACFSMEIGQLRGPVKTQFGFHLIRLDAKKAASLMAFEEIKDELEKKALSDKQHAAYQSKINQLKILFPVNRF